MIAPRAGTTAVPALPCAGSLYPIDIDGDFGSVRGMGGKVDDRVTIRPATLADVPAMARVHVDAWRTTYRGIVPDDYLAGLRYESRESMWRRILTEAGDRHAVYVAELPATGIVGIASGGPPLRRDSRFAAELHAIYILSAFQRGGLGRRLVAAVIGDLVASGMRSVLVRVLAANPSRAFYEALGGRLVRSETIDLGGAELQEVTYGWDDVALLLARAGGDDNRRSPANRTEPA
jgi:ribosomal protein S18 acetylase RimI-like enzyme